MRLAFTLMFTALTAGLPQGALAIDYTFNGPITLKSVPLQTTNLRKVGPAVTCAVFATTTPPANIGISPDLGSNQTYFSLRADGGYSGPPVSVKVTSGQSAMSYVCNLTAWDQSGSAITAST